MSKILIAFLLAIFFFSIIKTDDSENLIPQENQET